MKYLYTLVIFIITLFTFLSPTNALVCQLPGGNEICAQWCYRVLRKNGGYCQLGPYGGDGRCMCLN